jgi:hypothetical protein
MSRNEMESSWGKCEADMIRGPLATRRLSLSSHFESSQFTRFLRRRKTHQRARQCAGEHIVITGIISIFIFAKINER